MGEVEVNGESMIFKVTVASLQIYLHYTLPKPPHVTVGEAEVPGLNFSGLVLCA